MEATMRNGMSRVGRRMMAGVVGLAVVASLVGGVDGATGADAAAGPQPAAEIAKKGVPAAPVAAPVEECTQRKDDRPEHEWLTCIGVRAEVTKLPRVGEEGIITVSVTADANRQRTSVQVDLPNTARFSSTGRAALTTTRSLDGVGTAYRASVSTDLVKGRRVSYQYRFVPEKPGALHIRARAVGRVGPNRTDAGSDDVFITVGDGSTPSRLGADPAPTESGTAPVAATARLVAAAGKGKAAPVDPPPAGDDPVVGKDAPPGLQCVTGGWFFVDNNGVTRAAMNQQVQVWDDDSLSADDMLDSGVIGADGRYSFCVPTNDFDFLDDAAQEIYIRFVTSNSVWRVRNDGTSNSDYAFTTGIWDGPDGGDHEFGNLQPGDGTLMRGMHAFESLNKLWLFVHGANGCFDRNDASCRQMVLNWTNTSTDGTYYSLGANDIHLAADDPNAPTTVIHEGGHALMDDAYEDDFPPAPSCNPHSIPGATSQGCAWTEGFAEWLPAMVLNDPYYRWPDGGSLNLENPTWDSPGWDAGDGVEGRVAGAMIDLSDGSNEGTDLAAEGGSSASRQYTTFINTVSDTFNEFIAVDRVAQGFPLTDIELGSVHQNTIDYGFRYPLSDIVPKNREDARSRLHYYGANTTASYWSVFGVRPSASSDYDLTLYDDRGLTTILGSSAFFGDAVDFVAVDGNTRAAGDYYPRVNKYSGSGPYDVEFDNGGNSLSFGSYFFSMGAGSVVRTYDAYFAAGSQNTIRVVPAAGQDLAVFLMRPDGTSIKSRSAAAVAVDAGGAGVAETLTYTDSLSQWNGLIVVQKSGSGTFNVRRDTTAPTGSVTIGAGDPASTPTRNVTLVLSATDGESGVADMRVAVDGVVDTEPFEAFATSKAVTLSTGDGLKTVAVQYRNGVGLTTTVTDTITLDTRPNYVVSAVANPPTTTKRSATFGRSATVRNSGPTAAAASSQLRFYLSTDTTKSVGDLLLSGSRTIAPLAAGGSSAASTSLTVPAGAAPGVYYLLACADDTGVISEYSETDNCLASQATTTLKVPDYRVTSLSSPPATIGQGGSFSVTDSTKNVGVDPSAPSVTRYYLSLDTAKSASDVLVGTRSVPALGASTESTGPATATLTEPVKQGDYYLVACADDTDTVAEANETNNCKASATKVTVEAADLTVSALQNPPATRARGATFNVNETTKNLGNIASVGTRTRFYLSTDAVKDAGDTRLAVVHAVPGLVSGGINAGTFTLTVPSTLAPGAYRLLACADDLDVEAEGVETNNCKASTTTMNVT